MQKHNFFLNTAVYNEFFSGDNPVDFDQNLIFLRKGTLGMGLICLETLRSKRK